MGPLSAIQARIVASLVEKQHTTPEQYPLTVNALRNACNQKTARHPVTRYSEGEIGHALRELEALGLVREVWGARTPKYEHLAGKALGLYNKGLAVMTVLMLRGPQTPGELRTHTQRLYAFDDLEDVQFALHDLMRQDPPQVSELPRQSGQKEVRYAHLLCGVPEPLEASPTRQRAPDTDHDALLARIQVLEDAVAELQSRVGTAGRDRES